MSEQGLLTKAEHERLVKVAVETAKLETIKAMGVGLKMVLADWSAKRAQGVNQPIETVSEATRANINDFIDGLRPRNPHAAALKHDDED